MKYNKKEDHSIEGYIAEHTRNEEQIKYLLRNGDLATKAIAMFNPLVANEISNKLDELKKDKNEIIRYDAEYIETALMLRIGALSIDGIADKKAEEYKEMLKNAPKQKQISIN